MTDAPTYYTTQGVMLDTRFVDHHPVFDSLVFGFFLWAGDMLGSQNIGLYAFTLLQAIGTAFSFACACCYLDKLRVPRAIRFSVLALCAVFPMYPGYATTMMKDSFHAMFFVVYLIAVIEVVRSRGKALRSWKFVAIYIAIAGLCILTKKTGLFIVGVTSVVLFVAYYRDCVTHAVSMLLVPFLIFSLLLPAIVNPLIGGVAPGGRQETLGALFQQTMTAVMADSQGISQEDLDAIDSVFDLERAKGRFSSDDVDGVKNTFRRDSNTSDLAKFALAYGHIGLTHPVEYTLSIGRIALRLISPVSPFVYFKHFQRVYDSDEKYWQNVKAKEGDPEFTFSKPAVFVEIDNAICSWLKYATANIPVVGWLFTMGLYAGWMPITCFLVALFFSRRQLLAHAPLMVAFCFVLLSPISSPRYAVPFLYAAPLMVGLICWAMSDWQRRNIGIPDGEGAGFEPIGTSLPVDGSNVAGETSVGRHSEQASMLRTSGRRPNPARANERGDRDDGGSVSLGGAAEDGQTACAVMMSKLASPLRLDVVSKYRNELYGFAILWIVIFHGSAIDKIDYSFGQGWLNWLQSFISVGNVGVDIFLFLSGVCLFYSFSKSPSIKEFYVKRILRIVPAVWIVDGFYWFIRYVVLGGQPLLFASKMSLMRFFFTGDQSVWFVSCILILYLLYPFIYKILFYSEENVGLRCFLIMAAVYIGIVIASNAAPDYYSKIEIALTRVPVFIFGCYLGKAVKSGKALSAQWKIWSFVFVALFFLATSMHLFSGTAMRFFYLIGGVALSYCFTLICEFFDELLDTSAGDSDGGELSRPVVLRGLAFVGGFSLELYLSHIMLNQVLRMFDWYVPGTLWQYALVVVLAIPLAWIANKLVLKVGSFVRAAASRSLQFAEFGSTPRE